MRVRLAAALIAFALVALAGASASDPAGKVRAASKPYYTIVDLGAGLHDSTARAINNSGTVVGSGHYGDFVYKAIKWPPANNYAHPRAMDSSPERGSHQAYAIDKYGFAAGDSWLGTYRAAYWHGPDVLTLLGAFPGGTGSHAYGMNDSGGVVGAAGTPTATHAFVRFGGSLYDLGTLGGRDSFAYDINNRNVVVGASHPTPPPPCPKLDDVCQGFPHAFLWQRTGDSLLDGAMLNLGTLGGVWSEARAVNERNQVVGWSELGPALALGRHAFLWEKGYMRDLGTRPPGSFSEAYGINDVAQVVGRARAATAADDHAFIWQNGLMIDLNNLVSANAGWSLRWASGINNAGRIVGHGYRAGEAGRRAFLLVPLVQLSAFSLTPATVPGGVGVQGKVVLNRPAPPGGASVALSTTFANPNAAALVPQIVHVPAGSTSRSFPITTNAVTTTKAGTVTASYGGESRTASLTVRPVRIIRLQLLGGPPTPGKGMKGWVFLDGPAGPGPMVVRLATSNAALASLPATMLTIPTGSRLGIFGVHIASSPPANDESVIIIASGNSSSASASLRIEGQ